MHKYSSEESEEYLSLLTDELRFCHHDIQLDTTLGGIDINSQAVLPYSQFAKLSRTISTG
jgi:hypothetical protein